MYTPSNGYEFLAFSTKSLPKKNGINWLPLSIIVKGVFDILNRYYGNNFTIFASHVSVKSVLSSTDTNL